MSGCNYYEVEYQPEQLTNSGGPVEGDELRTIADQFVEQQAQRESPPVHVIWTRVVELGEEQGYPGGNELRLSILIEDDDEARAWEKAVAFELALTDHLKDRLALSTEASPYATLRCV